MPNQLTDIEVVGIIFIIFVAYLLITQAFSGEEDHYHG